MNDFSWIDIHYSDKNGTHYKWQRVHLEQVPKIIYARTDEEKYANWFCTIQHFNNPVHEDNELELCPLAFDFDCASDIKHAQADTILLVTFMINEYNIDISSEELMVYYSGNRGFHVTINHEVMEVEPQIDMMKVYRLMAENFYKELHLETLDRAVYTRRRAWRVPNTKHSKTGLYKCALTLIELEKPIEEIKILAQEPCSWIDMINVI